LQSLPISQYTERVTRHSSSSISKQLNNNLPASSSNSAVTHSDSNKSAAAGYGNGDGMSMFVNNDCVKVTNIHSTDEGYSKPAMDKESSDENSNSVAVGITVHADNSAVVSCPNAENVGSSEVNAVSSELAESIESIAENNDLQKGHFAGNILPAIDGSCNSDNQHIESHLPAADLPPVKNTCMLLFCIYLAALYNCCRSQFMKSIT
jgi:hypothetical protein